MDIEDNVTLMEKMMEINIERYFHSAMSEKELILRAGQKQIKEINLFLENKQTGSSIPKTNPQLLHSEIKTKIARWENISNMSFTRNGKIRISTSDAVCAIQIMSLEQLLNISVNTRIIWEGITSRFLLYEIPTNVNLEELCKELQEINNIEIVEIRRFLKPGTYPEICPVLITVLGTIIPESIKLWLVNHKIQLFIDKPRQCGKCFSYMHPTRFCHNQTLCYNCGISHTGTCNNKVSCINCKGDHPANCQTCPTYAKEKNIMELKCRQNLSLSEARRRLRTTEMENYATVVKTPTQAINVQNLIDKKFEEMMIHFQTILEKQTAFLMETLQKTVETMFSHICTIIDSTTRSTSPDRKKRTLEIAKNSAGMVSCISGNNKARNSTEYG